ncbi:TIGR02569 family protein [Tsukamurella soli]|uniref:TIGR02569 family protein n=1 Tax=Tsukamurella soli TaxID=644556 RepID=A0ABP8JJN8_9ACTN
MSPVEPPDHVLSTFGLDGPEPIALGSDWDGGWRVGEVVLSLVADHARAAWSAKVRENLYVEGMRLARPFRATDGRYVVSGWRADTFIAGAPEPRFDEIVSLANRLHEMTAKLDRPRFLLASPVAPFTDVDIFGFADRAAWEEHPLTVARKMGALIDLSPDAEHSVELVRELAALRTPVASSPQLVHGDLFGTVLFAGAAAPGITDITPYWRPASWAAAVIVVDALAWGGADDDLLVRWRDLPEWPQMVLRALIFRLSVHALHPRSTAAAFPGLQHATDLVRWLL